MQAGRSWFPALFLLLCFHSTTHSADPLDHWEVVAVPGQSLRGLAYGNGTFVAVGFNTNIVVSTNGNDWFKVSSGLAGGGLYAVTENAGQFVAVGPGETGGTILTSSNGLNWTRRFNQTNEEYWAVSHAAGQFVAVGFRFDVNGAGAVALTSDDGVNWLRSPLPFRTTPRDITYGNGVYLAPGGPVTLFSTNGRDWSALAYPAIVSAVFGAGQFIGSAHNGAGGTHRSTNGVNWTEVFPPSSPAINFYTAGYANGTFVLAGEGFPYGNIPAVPLMTSTNGVHWIPRTFTNNSEQVVLRDMVFVDGSFYVVDQITGKIWRSGRMRPLARPILGSVLYRGNTTQLTFSTVPGFRYTIERANELDGLPWLSFSGSILAISNNLTFAGPALESRQYYRVRTE